MNTLELNHAPVNSDMLEFTAPDLRDIERKGFVVVRDFLDREELKIILKDYNDAKAADNANYAIAFASNRVLDLLYKKVMSLADDVGKVTSTHVDDDQGLIYFSITNGINFPWHQDHECFYMNQNHIDYLNFYMVISKEKVNEANLRVIPFDRLKEKSPEVHSKVVGSGANWYTIRDGQTHIFSDEQGTTVGVLPYDISTLAEIPFLRAGDLLLLRGDVIHSTQAANSARIALSFRAVSSKINVNLKRMVTGAKPKMVMMTNHRGIYNKIFNAFETLKVNDATNAELKSQIIHDQSATPSKLRFRLRMFMLRLKLIFS